MQSTVQIIAISNANRSCQLRNLHYKESCALWIVKDQYGWQQRRISHRRKRGLNDNKMGNAKPLPLAAGAELQPLFNWRCPPTRTAQARLHATNKKRP
ncbi:hypothetical protein [Amantichitinum ursilacus]|uniref:hypothetical protein n=1 Tax=Amantichitinum ursilacus TaxID=857265 RepID=UPI0006B678ED|nr:hypothetical protein [Amantichitinum ursilacus]